ncbi:hypothetical protein V502_01236 [Pseudogymnoascus sp. VKM F-4520 (FW-2644)]|nr:hypothetical protein V502_01236 [Pseudogymnoascus sp. VKM F-4520 (FW-2644)]
MLSRKANSASQSRYSQAPRQNSNGAARAPARHRGYCLLFLGLTDLFNADLVHPGCTQVVFVKENGPHGAPGPAYLAVADIECRWHQVPQRHRLRPADAAIAVVATGNLKAMQVAVGPTHHDLQRLVQRGQLDIRWHLHTTPEARHHLHEGDLELIDRGVGRNDRSDPCLNAFHGHNLKVKAMHSTKAKRKQKQGPVRSPRGEHAAQRAWKVTVIVRDVASGASDRPQREQLLRMARRREIDAVLVWRLDRWGRSLLDLVVTLKELSELGVGFVSFTEALDLTTATGRAMAGMLAVFAEFEREILRSRVKAGIKQARHEGRRFGRPKSAALETAAVSELYAQQLSKSEIDQAGQ